MERNMNQTHHILIAFALLFVTIQILSHFFILKNEKKFWEDCINKFFGL